MNREILGKWVWVSLPVSIVVLLFALRGTLVRIGAGQMSRMQDSEVAADIADSIRLLYDYSDGRGLDYTFLEFGAKGCVSCRKMEQVMDEIRTEFADRVKVRFINVSRKEDQEWTKFFGIAMIPAQVVLDSTGREVFRHTGFISAEDLSKVFK